MLYKVSFRELSGIHAGQLEWALCLDCLLQMFHCLRLIKLDWGLATKDAPDGIRHLVNGDGSGGAKFAAWHM